MKKLLFFINSLDGGGAEKVIVDLVNSLDNSVYEITLVTVSGGIYQKHLSSYVLYRQLITCKNSFLSKILQRCLFRLPKSLVYRLVAKDEYDIEIAYLEGFPTKVISAGKSRAKKVAFVHCDVSVKSVLQKYYANAAACFDEYSRLDAVCFVSNLARQGFENTYGVLQNACVVHNVINVAEISEKATEEAPFSFNTDGLKIITVGRLTEPKAFDRLIRIAADLERKYAFEICILGEGALRNQLESLIGDLNVKSVRLLGFKENPYAYMVKADLFVCSSLFEGYSTAVTECMILNIPVLTTDCAGMDEILHNGKYGRIVENNEDVLRNALEEFLQNPNLLEAYIMKIAQRGSQNSLPEYVELFNNL